MILDGAHNAFKLAPLVATLDELYPGQQFTWVLALKHDKDLDAVLGAIARTAACIVATEFHTDGGDHPSSRSASGRRHRRGRTQHRPASCERAPAVCCSRPCRGLQPAICSRGGQRFVPPARGDRRRGRSGMSNLDHGGQPRPSRHLRPAARFDNLEAGSALAFPTPRRILAARRPEAVLPVLAAVTEATDGGEWAYGYVAYEAAAGLDPALSTHPHDPDGPPLAWFGLSSAPRQVPVIEDALQAGACSAVWRPEWSLPGYRSRVETVRAQIALGETYQTNLTVRMRGHIQGDPLDLYRDLALSQKGAYNAYLDLGEFVIASASPELFFQRCRDEVLLRPMKGTAARGRDVEQDHRRASDLRADPKERAENVMIVDLMRNDVSRIARTGTVRVPALLTVERYATVLQLTSDITAQMRPGTGLAELFAALFPCGSVTGTPKARTMALIRELEDTPRGIYCGAIGWVAHRLNPSARAFSVAIRTAVINRRDQMAVYGTGSGITWSSEPAAEHREVLAKTAILRRRTPFHLFETMRYESRLGIRNRDHHLARWLHRPATWASTSTRPLSRPNSIAGSTRCRTSLHMQVRLRLERDARVGIEVAEAPPCGLTLHRRARR